jgi:hypothetical protein
MNIKKFNKLFSKTCDEIYAIVGEKERYDKADAQIMLNGATGVIIRIFKIHEHRLLACRNSVDRIGAAYAEILTKTMGFEGGIFALTLGILEGTGEINLNSGLKLLAESLDVGGLKMSRSIN